MNPIGIIIGATATGKSDLAMQVARKTGAHILSCDSLLVYKDLNIGTAKPSDKEMSEVPHYGVNLVDAGDGFNAGDFVKYARPIIDKCMQEKTPLLIVGGTGFYLKALLYGVWDAPTTQPEIRERIEAEADEAVKGIADETQRRGDRAKYLHDRLVALDRDYASKIMVNDTYRVIRGLEIIEVTGEKVSQILAARQPLNPLPYPVKIYAVEREQRDLERRIIQRMNHMFERGLVREVEELIEKYTGHNAHRTKNEPIPDLIHQKVPRALHCVGYWEVLEFLAGKLTLPECRERVTISTRQLAKKQRTFFKGMFKDHPEHAPTWMQLPSQEDELIGLLT